MISKSHRISIPSVLMNKEDSIERLVRKIRKGGFRNVTIFWDENIRNIFGERIISQFKEESLTYREIIIGDVEACNILEKAFEIPSEVDCLVGIGGGKVIDTAKYMAFIRKRPFISVPTSTSNDGFCSPVASLIINGKRTTVPAKIPYGIVVDTSIIKSSPERFKYSGVGDLVSNITALWDWRYEEEHGVSRVDDFAEMISSMCVDRFINGNFHDINDGSMLKVLVDCLTLNGIAMEISGSSAPASGSEHLISHAMDKMGEKHYLHGIQVGIATYIVAKVQDNRYEDIARVFKDIGFFRFVKNMNIKKEEFIKAVDYAPYIKKFRKTIIHSEDGREKAKQIILKDEILRDILK